MYLLPWGQVDKEELLQTAYGSQTSFTNGVVMDGSGLTSGDMTVHEELLIVCCSGPV